MSFLKSTFFDDLKFAEVAPVFTKDQKNKKKDLKNSRSTYKPVRILPHVYGMFELLGNEQLVNRFDYFFLKIPI